MKKSLNLFGLVIALSFYALQACGQQQTYTRQEPVYGQQYGPSDYKWYVRADGGGNWTLDTELKKFFGESLADGSKVKFDAGWRFGVAGGYQITKWFAAEAQAGMIGNEIHSITDAHIHDAFFSNIPLLANVKFQCPHDCFITPYFGGGAGVSFSIIDADFIGIGNTSMDGSDADAVFAYQAFGGLRFRLNERMGISVEYRYFVAESPEWEAEFSHGSSSDFLEFGRSQTHAISIAFDYKF